MIKVDQTVVGRGTDANPDEPRGNCMQAVTASLFEMNLEEVPNFVESDRWFYDIWDFYVKNGYNPSYVERRDSNFKMLHDIAKYDGGINGYFDATVKSQTFEGSLHAVVVDVDLNIVHDPNPNRLALKLKPEDVEAIWLANHEEKPFYIKDGKLIKEKWKPNEL